jgi:transcriptional regulator with XRE-family HTH domain
MTSPAEPDPVTAKGRRRCPRVLHHEPEAVARTRKKAGLTKRALARRADISEVLMGELESGWRSATPANPVKIADALSCPVVFLERKQVPRADRPFPRPVQAALPGLQRHR